jgi:hypothetical protein
MSTLFRKVRVPSTRQLALLTIRPLACDRRRPPGGEGSQAESRKKEERQRDMWPTTLGVFLGIFVSVGFMSVVPSYEGFNILDRIKWGLTASVLVAYGVTYALPATA